LKLSLFDGTKQELAADLSAAGVDLVALGLYRVLGGEECAGRGGEPRNCDLPE
jgi:hypothetical protein